MLMRGYRVVQETCRCFMCLQTGKENKTETTKKKERSTQKSSRKS